MVLEQAAATAVGMVLTGVLMVGMLLGGAVLVLVSLWVWLAAGALDPVRSVAHELSTHPAALALSGPVTAGVAVDGSGDGHRPVDVGVLERFVRAGGRRLLVHPPERAPVAWWLVGDRPVAVVGPPDGGARCRLVVPGRPGSRPHTCGHPPPAPDGPDDPGPCPLNRAREVFVCADGTLVPVPRGPVVPGRAR